MESSNAVYYWGLVWYFEFQDHILLVSGKLGVSEPTSPCTVLTGLKYACISRL